MDFLKRSSMAPTRLGHKPQLQTAPNNNPAASNLNNETVSVTTRASFTSGLHIVVDNQSGGVMTSFTRCLPLRLLNGERSEPSADPTGNRC